jgi:aminoglycoside phosphotransferase (APT) family kinase protein
VSRPAGRLAEVLEPALAGWLTDRIGSPGPWELRRLTGGNSNETCLLTSGTAEYILRRPPRHALSASAHSVAREHRLLTALAGTGVPAPRPVALCEDPAVPLAPFTALRRSSWPRRSASARRPCGSAPT